MKPILFTYIFIHNNPIINSLNSINNSVVKRKKEFNKEYNKKYGKSKNARDTKKTMLDGLQSIIEFNESNYFRMVERLNLVNDLYNNIMSKDYITGKYSLERLGNQVEYFKNNIKTPEGVIKDFIEYSRNKINKTKRKGFISFTKENSIILDRVNSESI